jgi:hypothetical protein
MYWESLRRYVFALESTWGNDNYYVIAMESFIICSQNIILRNRSVEMLCLSIQAIIGYGNFMIR